MVGSHCPTCERASLEVWLLKGGGDRVRPSPYIISGEPYYHATDVGVVFADAECQTCGTTWQERYDYASQGMVREST